MPTLNFRSPVLKPLLRKGTPKPVPPDPRAHDTFAVTQQFADEDYYWRTQNRLAPVNSGPRHHATDIGNFRCNDPIVAMAPGVAYRVYDSAGALGIRIDHGHGILSESWHLNRQDTYNGQPVNAGFQIGLLGSTGLGAICHTHIEVKRNGLRIDPEPLMFGGFLVVPEDDDVKIKGKFLRHISNRRTVTTVDAHFRAGVDTGDDESLTVLGKGAQFFPVVAVEGRAAGTGPDAATWYGGIKTAGIKGEQFGYVHSSVLAPFERIDGGYSANDLQAAKTAGEADGIKKGRTAMKTEAVAAANGLRP